MGNFYARYIGDKLCKECTPIEIAEAMVEMIPADKFNANTKFLSCYCKTGVFLIAIRNRLMKTKELIDRFPDPKNRRRHIEREQLYGLCWTKEFYEQTTCNVYESVLVKGNIHIFDKDPKIILKIENISTLDEEIKETFGDMKFDVVIGNPPYNGDLYIDFVTFGSRVARQCSVWITPAKWQTKSGEKNKTFREKIVPYMDKVVFYPSCSDVFEIKIVDGISYFRVVKTTNEKIEVINKCKYQNLLESTQIRSIKNQEPLLNAMNDIVNTIVNKIGKYNSINIEAIDYRKKYMVYGNSGIIGSRGKPNMYQAIGMISYATGKSGILGNLSITENDEINRGLFNTAEKIWFTANTIDECKSFISWIKSKFVQFCIFGWMSTRTINNNVSFGRVPCPDRFDHIFTDKELYQEYGLTPEQIHIIDSVIK